MKNLQFLLKNLQFIKESSFVYKQPSNASIIQLAIDVRNYLKSQKKRPVFNGKSSVFGGNSPFFPHFQGKKTRNLLTFLLQFAVLAFLPSALPGSPAHMYIESFQSRYFEKTGEKNKEETKKSSSVTEKSDENSHCRAALQKFNICDTKFLVLNTEFIICFTCRAGK